MYASVFAFSYSFDGTKIIIFYLLYNFLKINSIMFILDSFGREALMNAKIIDKIKFCFLQ